jgi:phosphoserine phosphatase
MPTEGKRIDFFDVDHTITRHATGWNFARFGIKRKLIPCAPSRDSLLLSSVPLRQVQRAGVPQQARRLQGLRKSDLEEVARESFEKRLRRTSTRTRMSTSGNSRRRGEDRCSCHLLAHVIVKPLADFLGIDIVIASLLQYEDGVCTGRFLCPPVFGREKMKRVLSYIEGGGYGRFLSVPSIGQLS